MFGLELSTVDLIRYLLFYDQKITSLDMIFYLE
jgi:hypothetical protein